MASRKKEKQNIPKGIVYIQATFNNTLITVTDLEGNSLGWSSAGMMKFRGSRKSTPYAAQIAARHLASKVKEYGLREVDVMVKGPGIGRESAVRAFSGEGIHVRKIKDTSPLPHNGCRARKQRRA